MLLTVLFLMAYPQSQSHSRDQAVTRSDVWQPVGGGDLITADYSIIYSNRFQAGDHWPLDTRDTDISGHYPALISGWWWPRHCDQASAHSLSHYVVPESHRPHALTPEIDVNPELRHFKLWVNWVPSPVTRISFPRSNFIATNFDD